MKIKNSLKMRKEIKIMIYNKNCRVFNKGQTHKGTK